MHKKNIMIITEAYGGGVKTHVDIINENIDEFNIVTVISDREPVSKEIKKSGNEKYFTINNLSSKNPFKILGAVKQIKQILKNQNIDLIHSHSTKAGIYSLMLKFILRGNKVKFIYTPHAYYSQNPKLNKLIKFLVTKIEMMICKNASTVIHVSKGEEIHALENKIVDESKSTVIYNGINKKENPTNQRKQDDVIVLGNLARVKYQKNPEGFIELAKSIINNSSIPVKFIYGGDGPELNRMRNIVKRYNLEGKIEFIGYVDNIDSFFNSIDVFISTAFYEGLPYSVIEAMSYGKPLFLSNVIGHIELIDGNGLLFNLNNNQSDIANSIISKITNEEILHSYSIKSLNLFERQFSKKNMIKKLKQIYYNELY